MNNNLWIRNILVQKKNDGSFLIFSSGGIPSIRAHPSPCWTSHELFFFFYLRHLEKSE